MNNTQPIPSIHMKDDNSNNQQPKPSPIDEYESDQMDDSNDYHQIQSQWQSQYAKWALKSKNKLKAKLSDNLDKRVEAIQNAVDNATLRITNDNLVLIMNKPPRFKVSSTIKSGALERMFHIIESWGGVDIAQCENPPKDWKRYWRLADNWWNRQKGKWFGDLLFWPVLQYNLNLHCQKILINKHNEYHYHATYFIFLCDIIHSEVQFKKSRPVPLIFDLALQKSANLTQWLKSTGNRHKLPWDLSKRPAGQKGVEKYARAWCKLLRDSLYRQYQRYEQAQLDNDQFTNDNDISVGDSTESKTNDNDQDMVYALGQNRALPEPVKPRDPPHPVSRRPSLVPSYHGNTIGNNSRLPPIHQSHSSQPQTTMTIPTPINQFLPRPRRRGQLYYLLEMKENKPLTQQQLDALSQHSYISTHISVDDTSSTTFNGNQPSTPSTTAETPRSNISGISLPMSLGSNLFSNGSQRSALGIYGNNNNRYGNGGQSAPRYRACSMINPSFHASTSNRYDRNNLLQNGLGHISMGNGSVLSAQSNAMASIQQNNNNGMTLDAQCDVMVLEDSSHNPFQFMNMNASTTANTNTNTSVNTISHQSVSHPPNLPPPIEIDQVALNMNPPNHSTGLPQNDSNDINTMLWSDNYVNNMSISNSYVNDNEYQ